jgi:acyl dehydratase
MTGKLNIGDLNVGDSASVTKSFSQEEVVQFADISGDHNPIHLDEEIAAASIFGQRVVHGMLVASLFSGLIGEHLPGQGSIYLGQNLSFKAPVLIGEEVTASVEITGLRDDKPIVTLQTICRNSQGKVVIKGEAIVLFS